VTCGVEVKCGTRAYVAVEVGEGIMVEVNPGILVGVAVATGGSTEMGKPAHETATKRMNIILK
jgi:hypothetical protein